MIVIGIKCETYHFELGLGLLHKILLLRLSDAGENAHLWVEVQHVAVEICQEVSKTPNATDSNDTLRKREKSICVSTLFF